VLDDDSGGDGAPASVSAADSSTLLEAIRLLDS
jgi:hypothetical protein